MKSVFLWWISWLARLQLKKNSQAEVIGITGSGGKSSTREAIFAAIQGKKSVKHCAFGNSETGVPLDILGIKPNDYSLLDWIRMLFLAPWKVLCDWKRYEVLLLELGIDSPDWPGNMDFLLTIVKPTIGVFTSVSSVHGQMFDILLDKKLQGKARELAIKKAIAAEKGKLLHALPNTGSAVVYGDEPLITDLIPDVTAHVISFGTSPKNTIVISKTLQSTAVFQVHYSIAGHHYDLEIKDQVLGPTYGRTFAAALGVAQILKLDLQQVIKGIETNFKLPPSRMNALKGISNSLIIDSSYNASHASMLEAITLVQNLESRHKIAILGDMREVGASSNFVHQDVLEHAREVFDVIVLVGEQFGKVVAAEKDMTETTICFNKADKKCIESVKKLIKDESLILVKGSQNTIFLERIVEALLQNKDDVKKLCRQSAHWKQVKEAFFKED